MSLASDLAASFAEREITVPLLYGAQGEVRGILDEEGAIRPVAGTHVQTLAKTLYVQTGALLNLQRDTQIVVGAMGAASAAGGVTHNINDFRPIDDGAITAIELSGAP